MTPSLSHKTQIGVFDSGVGGLTVLRELTMQVPDADYLYFGDTARLPYGSKSVETVAKYVLSAIHFLEQQGAERLVIACNTACALAFDQIVAATKLPVTGVILPGAHAAAAASRHKRVLVLATEGTVGSHAYRTALAQLGVTAEEKACPLFVPLVEEGWTDHPVTEQVAHLYLDELLGQPDVDVLVLGCTHYPLLRPLLQRVLPRQLTIVDSAESTAGAVARALGATARPASEPSGIRFFATDSVEKFRRAGEKFLGRQIDGVEHVDLE
jgi:glutamate racemase